MKFLFIDTYYPEFLNDFYSKNKEIINKGYNEQKKSLLAEIFGVADFYPSNLIKLGYQAEVVIANNEFLQKQWAKERGIRFTNFSPSFIVSKLPTLNSFIRKRDGIYYPVKNLIFGKNWLCQILIAQIKNFQPDILYILDLNFLPPSFFKKIKKYVKMIVGQIASPLPPKSYLRNYDLIITSFPHYVEKFRKIGINSEYLKHAFEPKVLRIIGFRKKKYRCTFVGGITFHHNKTDLLEELAKRIDIDFFGYGKERLNKFSPIIPKHHGPIWGKEMYKTLAESEITINRHIDAAENYANNLRLYEATGMGSMLITDMKDNLSEIFEIGKEIETYDSAEELIEKIKYYSKHDKEREAVANAGQKRTLQEHTYESRMKELLNILRKYL